MHDDMDELFSDSFFGPYAHRRTSSPRRQPKRNTSRMNIPVTSTAIPKKSSNLITPEMEQAAQIIQKWFRQQRQVQQRLSQLVHIQIQFMNLVEQKQQTALDTELHFAVSDASNSSRRIVYDANAQYVLGFEQELVNLLLSIDDIDSVGGNVRVKRARRKLVSEIEKVLKMIDSHKHNQEEELVGSIDRAPNDTIC